ncbi:hypothetical protein BASA81_001177 [Batrachochytrium salamandrivorans]|nr:hypothetical protein BASA81_001177 [Batrachochytrium salamandrivorans]
MPVQISELVELQHQPLSAPASPSSSSSLSDDLEHSSGSTASSEEDEDEEAFLLLPDMHFADLPIFHHQQQLLPHDFNQLFAAPQAQPQPALANPANHELFSMPLLFASSPPAPPVQQHLLVDPVSPANRKRQRLVVATRQMEDIVSALPTSPKPPSASLSPKNSSGSLILRSRTSSSAYRGVSRCTKDGRWQARIRIQKEVVYLGRYPTEELAAKRYDEAARLNHGRQAVLNFITPEDLLGGCKSVFSSSSASLLAGVGSVGGGEEED